MKGGLISELKRRKVFRVAGAYAIAAFAVLQVADLAVEPLRLPEWTMTLLWVLVLAGFFLALVLAWAFDLVPDRDADADQAEGTSPVGPAAGRPAGGSARGRRIAAATVAAVVLILAGILGARQLARTDAGPPSTNAIAVLPFHVQGSPGLEYLQEGMVDLLSRNLDGAAGLRSVDPVRVVELAGGETVARLGRQEAGDVARRIGAGQFVLGSVSAVAGQVRIHASLYALNDSIRSLATSEVEGDTTELFTLVDRLTAELLAGQPLGAASQSLARSAAVTSRSLEALKAYLEGERLFRAADFDAAIARFAEAVEADSAFALAHYRQAVAHAFNGNFAESAAAADRAVALPDRMARHDRLLAEALELVLDGEFPEARDRYRAILREYPEDIEAKVHLGMVLELLSPLEARPLREARALLEEVREVDPQFQCTQCSLARLAALEGAWAEWEEYARAIGPPTWTDFGIQFVLAGARREAPVVDSLLAVADTADNDVRHSLHHAAHLMTWPAHRPDLAVRIFEREAGWDARPIFSPESMALGETQGRWQESYAAVASTWERTGHGDLDEWLTFEFLVHMEPAAEVPRPLLSELRRRLPAWRGVTEVTRGGTARSRSDPPWLIPYYEGLAASRAGDVAGAQAAARSLEADPYESAAVRRVATSLAAVIRADLALRGEDPTGVLSALEHFDLRIPLDLYSSLYPASAYAAALRIEALLELERYRQALPWLEHSMIGVDRYYAFAQYRLGLVHDALGDRERAAVAYARFVAAWEHADPSLPLVDRARAELARLTAEGSVAAESGQ